METKIGYGVTLENSTPREALEQTVRAENIGFDSVWVDDHFHPWHHTNAECGQSWVWMGAALQATKKIFMSTCITCPILRYQPAIVAQAFATMRQMYPGRVGLAVGSGEAMNEVPVVGKWPSGAERRAMTVEAVEVMRKLWESDENVTFKGDYYSLDKAFLYTKPEDEVPLYFSGIGPIGSYVAGQHGDHLITVISPPDHLKNVTLPNFEKGARDAGKNPDEMERTMTLFYSIDPDYEKALDALDFWCGALAPAMVTYKVYDSREIEMHGNLMSREAKEASFVIATDPEDLIKKIEVYKDIGMNHFALSNSSPDVNYGIDVFKEIIPHLKD
ncbi:MAG: TIGR03557 family F420-dependent LLM class oxidoreductase [Methanofollis sp.]|uniref:TIGR03557 family F420-dependent LLM class oxidoreductase n=1 Tax=Methanofollis sp. TaxID=2052835 RepID=UPI00260195DD|nr:TIGR03557 family F420-dependent LLM class oxidoreductase [Methanofollis sp.]MDD4255540.1 TIGR03557 family F420-dependent LLM class oxidoreductase [Methanofollis sp.]